MNKADVAFKIIMLSYVQALSSGTTTAYTVYTE